MTSSSPRCAHVSSDAAADEVVGETWLAVITGIDRFEQRSEAGAPDVAVDPDRFRPAGTPGAGSWASPPVPWDEEPETHLSAGETLDVVRRAVAALPSGQQMVITLRDLEGWRADEVCNALDLSETNQRVLLHRARAKVRAALEQHFEESVR